MENEDGKKLPLYVANMVERFAGSFERLAAHGWNSSYECPEREIIADWPSMKPGDVISLLTYSGFTVHAVLVKSYKATDAELRARLVGKGLPNESFAEIESWLCESFMRGRVVNLDYHCIPWDAIEAIVAVRNPTSEEQEWSSKILTALAEVCGGNEDGRN